MSPTAPPSPSKSVMTSLLPVPTPDFIEGSVNESEAYALADRVVIMSEGTICQTGRPQDVYRAPRKRSLPISSA